MMKRSEGQTLWWVRGDLDGFFGLALDNLIQLLLIVGLCGGVLGFPTELVYGRILPGAALSILVGNLAYSYQAMKLARRTGRRDVTALPYGINTVSLLAFVFLIMLPVQLGARSQGMSAEDASTLAWQAGLVACLWSGIIEILGALVAPWVRRVTPRAAMLAALAGIAVTFIAIGFFFQTYASPLTSFVPLAVILAVYFGGVKLPLGIPGGLVAVTLGTALAWGTGLLHPEPAKWAAASSTVGLHLPVPAWGDLLSGVRGPYLLQYLSVILPMGLFNLLGSLQNIESAEAAGDSYPTTPSLIINGIGSLVAAGCGSCFPPTIYIGHPGWKELGARIGYSTLNGVFISLLCLTGTLGVVAYWVPVEAGMAIVLWIGIVMVAQAFQAVPRSHAAAVAVGLLPGIAAWGTFMAKGGLHAAGMGNGPSSPSISEGVIPGFLASGIHIHGAFALEQGSLLTSMLLAALTVSLIQRRFLAAAAWSLSASALSALGLVHAYHIVPFDTLIDLRPFGPGMTWAGGYLGMAAVFAVAHFLPHSPAREAPSGEGDATTSGMAH